MSMINHDNLTKQLQSLFLLKFGVIDLFLRGHLRLPHDWDELRSIATELPVEFPVPYLLTLNELIDGLVQRLSRDHSILVHLYLSIRVSYLIISVFIFKSLLEPFIVKFFIL